MSDDQDEPCPLPGQTPEQFASYLAGRQSPRHRDTLSLFHVSSTTAGLWVASPTKTAALDHAWHRELLGKGRIDACVESYDYVLALGRPDCHATIMHRDGMKAWLIDPFVRDPRVDLDVPFDERVASVRHTDTEAEFRAQLTSAGWWVLELLDGRHLVEIHGKDRIASRRDTRCLLAAWVGNEFHVEPSG